MNSTRKASILMRCSRRRTVGRTRAGRRRVVCSIRSSNAWPALAERTEVAVATGSRSRARSRVRFTPIQQLRAHEYVVEQIRRHIALRLIAPGESLPSERELTAMFGVGRPTIQHALRLLEADRLVEARRGRRGGTFVSQPLEDEIVMDELTARLLRRRDELDELLVYRRTLEPSGLPLGGGGPAPGRLPGLRPAVQGENDGPE